jgi:tetratricopeptide (TPR) repeat protein
VDRPAGLIDVAPTILDYLHVPAPPSFEGRSLLPALDPKNAVEPAAVYAENVYTHDAFGWAALHSLRAGKYKYIAAPRPELYNLEQDPQELHNLAAQQPAEAISLRRQLANLIARNASRRSAAASAGTVSPEKAAVLKSLGYLAPGPRAALTADGPDPKDRLTEYGLYEQAQHEVMSGRHANAVRILRQLLDRDPGNTLARRDLGIAYNAQGSYAEARTSLQQVLAVAPSDFVSHFELGMADEHLGLFPEALEQLGIACRMAPQSGGCDRELKGVEEKAKAAQK